jgi:hypothetical protein
MYASCMDRLGVDTSSAGAGGGLVDGGGRGGASAARPSDDDLLLLLLLLLLGVEAWAEEAAAPVSLCTVHAKSWGGTV